MSCEKEVLRLKYKLEMSQLEFKTFYSALSKAEKKINKLIIRTLDAEHNPNMYWEHALIRLEYLIKKQAEQ